MLILHYTGMESAEAALDWLTREESKVSCHYLIDEEGRIAQMVAEEARAWHAGQSLWAGETDLNSCSIGIEIHNPGHDFDYPDFPEANARRRGALPRHPGPARHSARPRARPFRHCAGRKRDPGEKFDWQRLARAGIGLWVPPVPLAAMPALVPAMRERSCRVAKRAYRLRLRSRADHHLRHRARESGRGLPAPFPHRPDRRPRRRFHHRDAWRLLDAEELVAEPSW